ncbi:MAG: tetratricopeptide repeat protein [Proteobacteria bacterium]|nr:tetratricopeptide repeat protein [Pseudomonadota bacterium]MDA1356642.1 tetratricopeptide repeat protein [Pseudomonadota bacterium]
MIPLQSNSTAPEQQTLTIKQALDLAIQHHTVGRLPDAEKIYQSILRADPDQPDALHLLGVIAHQESKNGIAVDLITKAIAINSDLAEAHNSLGVVLRELGKRGKAVVSYRNALAVNPGYAEAHNNLGIALKELGDLDEAVECYRRALAINPDNAETHSNLGNALLDLGMLDEAVTSFHQSLAIRPDLAETHNNLGTTFQAQGKPDVAFACYRRAIALNPRSDLFWAGFAESLEYLSLTSIDDDLWRDLLLVLDKPTVRPIRVVQPILSALRHNPDFSAIIGLTGSEDMETGIAYGGLAERLSAIPLFLRVMGLSPIHDLEIERMLTHLRRAMSQEAMSAKTCEKSLPFSAALALQCFTNKYVFNETEEEKAVVEQLQQRIATLVEKTQDVPASLVAALGAYRPLYGFAWAGELSEREWTGAISGVIERQISQPLKEQVLRSQIVNLTSIQNPVSQLVREQYEENPYPRWINTGLRETGKTIGAELLRAPLRLDLGDYESPESPEILVAGCGTGQHALSTASRFSNARVLAVDLSLSSLSYAWRKTEELGVKNIEYVQADIMELGNLGRQFDLIECIGVLHHLDDPLAGWRVLMKLLRPGGLMNIGLYSEIARQHIVSGRRLIAENGYTTSPDDIRRCRRDIITKAKDGNQVMAEIFKMKDFFNLSECRDLLFHVQEHRFTLIGIDEALRELGLKFLGFTIHNQKILRKFKDSYPSGGDLISLQLWHEFEFKNPDTFRGMYQFWCQKI